MNKRQILVLILVLVIITAGVLQYNLGDTKYSNSNQVDERLGEAVYVDSLTDKYIKESEVKPEAKEKENKENKDKYNKDNKEVLEASKVTNDYFAQARLERDSVRSKEKEELMNITKEAQADKEMKDKAYSAIMDIVKKGEMEMKIESLIKQRNFEDALVYFSDDGSVDLIVKAKSLSPSQTAQICDIVSRYANVKIENIHIKNMY